MNERPIQTRPKHADHPSETVIHHPEDDETILARWVRRGLEQGTGFWLVVGLIGVAAVSAVVLVNRLTAPDAAEQTAWTRIVAARTADDLVEAADLAGDTTPAAHWGRLQAAEMLFNEGSDGLATSRDAALPILTRASDLFEEVRTRSTDPMLKRLATLGIARCLEARGELEPAIAIYDEIATTWPDTPEADRAIELAARLKRPEAIAFYRELSSFKPSAATLPPLGSETFSLPGAPGIGPAPTNRGLDVPALPGESPTPEAPPTGGLPSSIFDLPPPPPTDPPATTPPASAPAAPTIPDSPFAPADEPKAEPPKAAEPSAPVVPDDPFAPGDQPKG